MITKGRIYIFILITAFAVSFTGCSTDDTVAVNINLNLQALHKVHPPAKINITDSSIVDRIMRLFTRDAKAQTPPGITAINVTVSGTGMSTISQNFPASSTSVTINVPAGTARLFQVTALIPVGDYGGSATADLDTGETSDISITMAAQFTAVTISPTFTGGTPINITSYTVDVTTAGQAVITTTVAAGTPIQVPSGAAKDFVVLANTPSVSFRGIPVQQTLTANSSLTIPVTVSLYESRIVVPDLRSARIVQIDDMAGTGLIDENQSTLNLASISIATFSPYDVDFDTQGRIYIANNDASTSSGIIRLDDILDNNPELVGGSTMVSLVTVAVDRVNSLLYYATSSTLRQNNLTNTAETGNLTLDAGVEIIQTIRGVEVDDTGTLFIAGNNSLGQARIFKYNPVTQNVDAAYSSVELNTPWDVLFKSPYIYIANFLGTANNQIIRLNPDFTSPVGYGLDVFGSNVSPGNFYGPRRFIGIRPSELVIIDDEAVGFDADKLISIDDISGANWTVFGNSTSNTPSEFDFYDAC